MGAFYLQRGDKKIAPDVYQIFNRKGFKPPKEFSVGGYRLLIYGKQHLESINCLESGADIMFVIGSCFYKDLAYETGLNKLFGDFRKGDFDGAALRGSFFLLFWVQNELTFCTDAAGVQNVYFHAKIPVISSSFLASVAGSARHGAKLKLNKHAIAETLCTGNLIGQDTYVLDIIRYEKKLHPDVHGIKPLLSPYFDDVYKHERLNFSDEADRQIEALKSYFRELGPVLSEHEALTGLTGGLDSRLLYLALSSESENYRLYTTWKGAENKDYKLTAEIAEKFGEELYSPTRKPGFADDEDELMSGLEANFYFNDGIVRSFQNWFEDIKSRDYLLRLYGDSSIGMSGVGGEQYRNHNYLSNGGISILSFVKNELIKRNAERPFTSDGELNELADLLSGKIKRRLGIDERDKLSFLEIKRYYNEVYNPSTRTLRNNIENQLVFFLSPFTEFNVSQNAYSAVQHLGNHHNFEKEMIFRLCPGKAYITTDYGYRINGKVSTDIQLTSLVKRYAGLSLYTFGYNKVKRKGENEYTRLINRFSKIRNLKKLVEELMPSLNTDLLLKSGGLSALVLQTGYFIQELSDYIETD